MFKTLGAQIAQDLRGRIVNGSIGRGQHIVETELADVYDVSRGPVRDAIRELAMEGLVEIRRGKAYALGMTVNDVHELYSVRDALERLAVQRVVERRHGVQWAPMDEALEEMRRASRAADAHAFGAADLAFHAAFYQQSGHRRVLQMWTQLRPTLAALLDYNAQDRDLAPSVHAHEHLLQVTKTDDLHTVLEQVSAHLSQAQDRITKAMSTAANRQHATA